MASSGGTSAAPGGPGGPGGAGTPTHDLVAALLAARSDHASARFDEELAAAEADGRVDGPTARTLRWWQRETLRGIEEHVRAVLPAALEALAAADREGREAVAAAAEAWQAAQPQHTSAAVPQARAIGAPAPQAAPAPAPAAPAPSPPSAPEPPDDGGSRLGTVTELPMRHPDPPGPGFTSHLAPHHGPVGTGAPPPLLLRSGHTVLDETHRDTDVARPEDR